MPRKVVGVAVILLLLAGIWWFIKNAPFIIGLAGNAFIGLFLLIFVVYLLFRLLKWCFSRT